MTYVAGINLGGRAIYIAVDGKTLTRQFTEARIYTDKLSADDAAKKLEVKHRKLHGNGQTIWNVYHSQPTYLITGRRSLHSSPR